MHRGVRRQSWDTGGDVIVGIEYVDRIGDDVIWLNADLTLFIEGRDVVNGEGNVIGKVTEVDRVKETNSLKGLYVSGSDGETYVDADEIREICGEGVYLK